MARLPIGDTAMTGAERQRRHRASHRQEETLEAKCRRLAAENARLKRAKVGMTERLPTKRIVELLWLALGARKCAAVAQALLRRWNDDVRDAGGAPKTAISRIRTRLWIVVQAGALLPTGSAGIAGAGEPPDRPASETAVADGDLSLFLAGDAIITQPWSADGDAQFLGLLNSVRSADVALVNLELVLHDFAGYGQADNGGMHLSARPHIAKELAWAGVDMVSGANNHSFDYGSQGVLDTVASAGAAGLVIAGSGRDLQAARAPAYFDHPDGTVALVSTAATFVPYGKASRTRADMQGRPGLNPLTTVVQLELPSLMARALWAAGPFVGLRREALSDDAFLLLDQRVQGVDGLRIGKGRWIDPETSRRTWHQSRRPRPEPISSSSPSMPMSRVHGS